MTERDERWARPPRKPSEGVRIIGAEEAQAALEAGEAAGRRPDDQLRYGDVPPAPSGPRPAHRFPLPDSVDPARAVSLPPLAPGRRPGEGIRPGEGLRPGEGIRPGESLRPGEGRRPVVGVPYSEEPGRSVPETPPVWEPPPAPPPAGGRFESVEDQMVPRAQAGDGYGEDSYDEPSEPDSIEGAGEETTEMGVVPEPPAPPEFERQEPITVSGTMPDMPHWTDPPTGEVPRLRFEDDVEENDDDLDAWRALGSRGIRWRDEDDWDDADGLTDLVDDAEPTGVFDSSRSEHSDLYSFDEEFERVTNRNSGETEAIRIDDDFDELELEEPVPPRAAPVGATGRPASHRVAAARDHRRRPPRPTGPPGGGELGGRVAVGIGLIALLAIAYAVGAKALLVLSLLIVTAAAAEAYQMIRSAGFRPATLLGLIATVGMVLSCYWRGIEAIPIVAVLLFAGAMAWYVLGIVEARPLANVAVTVMVFVWVGILGSFSAVMLRQSHGKGEFLGAVVVAVAADVCAFGVGRWIGSRPMAPSISPNKTVEGFIGGLVGALIAGAIIGKEVVPWGGMKHGLILGLVIGLISPVGDLFESMIKRDLGVKDSGSILAGHGGLLDRFDGILIAMPAAFFVLTFFKL